MKYPIPVPVTEPYLRIIEARTAETRLDPITAEELIAAIDDCADFLRAARLCFEDGDIEAARVGMAEVRDLTTSMLGA